ncbi:MAG: hypothetical protein MMC23_008599 [Stictis urceolatum]|nr:hypothetical protein [Stictis urceolata]
MASTGLGNDEPNWSFLNVPEPKVDSKLEPDSDTEPEGLRHRVPGYFEDEPEPPTSRNSGTERKPHPRVSSSSGMNSDETPLPDAQRHNPNRTYAPRTCRICLEVVQPTFHPPNPSLPSMFRSSGYVTYDSEEAESGRLLRPCKCKGSSRYVHEACLQQWRHADPSYGSRNYYSCPTCGFKYRVQRMDWGRWINNLGTQIGLTLLVFLVAMFVLGFIADPIINLYLDPYGSIVEGEIGRDVLTDVDEEGGWAEHFLKGLASIGLLGFIKVIILSPFQYWQMRQTGMLNTGRGNTGRDRIANLSWLVLLIGIGTFLYAVWKFVRHWSRRTLEKASEKVMDVPLADDDDEDVDMTAAH